MPKKPTKWGIKTWTLADASNGHIWNVKEYTDLKGRVIMSTQTFFILHLHCFLSFMTIDSKLVVLFA
uniref:PiggyBac transposable element-derived protein domain-containing protein n=1 Tax=Amphimedon queenslandica TaxID=400682 RepID=A0A1X7UEB5_AMPQE